MTGLEKAIIEITGFLEDNNIPYMVIGGVANAFFGIPRATIDIDITIMVEESYLDGFVKLLASKFNPFPDDPIRFVKETRVLPVKTTSGIRADIIFGQLPYEKSAIIRAHKIKVENVDVKICSPEDLILHKILSEREKDLSDVEGIISSQAEKLDRAYLDPLVKQVSEELTQPEILEFYNNCFAENKKL